MTSRRNTIQKDLVRKRCIKCGEIFDVDMDQIPDLLERIHNTMELNLWIMIFHLKAFARNAGRR